MNENFYGERIKCEQICSSKFTSQYNAFSLAIISQN